MSYTIEQLGRTTRSYCGAGRLALCPVNTRFAHFMFLIDDDGIVSANASKQQYQQQAKVWPLEMSPFDRRRST